MYDMPWSLHRYTSVSRSKVSLREPPGTCTKQASWGRAGRWWSLHLWPGLTHWVQQESLFFRTKDLFNENKYQKYSKCFHGDSRGPVLHSSVLPDKPVTPALCQLYTHTHFSQVSVKLYRVWGRFCFSSCQCGLLSSSFILCNYMIHGSWCVIVVNYLTPYRHMHDVCWKSFILIKNRSKPFTISQPCGNKSFRNCWVVCKRNRKQDLNTN